MNLGRRHLLELGGASAVSSRPFIGGLFCHLTPT
jgi:hypothetical protein